MPDGYRPLFDPANDVQPAVDGAFVRSGDEPPPGGYVYDREGRIATAVNIALATGRPLLVRGRPGTGKSSLAEDVARRLGRRYYRATITSRSRARDLLWTFDAVRRLNDANAKQAGPPIAYVTPGVLWWALSPEKAKTRTLTADQLAEHELPALVDPSPRIGTHAVVLLDEIDKADPDLPNDLLVPLGAFEFLFTELERPVRIAADIPPLVVITTNEERDLPQAFMRRCVVLSLPDPKPERILEVARAHFDDVPDTVLDDVLEAFQNVCSAQSAGEHRPGLAEFLDAVAAVRALGVLPDGGDRWDQVADFAWRKPAPPS